MGSLFGLARVVTGTSGIFGLAGVVTRTSGIKAPGLLGSRHRAALEGPLKALPPLEPQTGNPVQS